MDGFEVRQTLPFDPRNAYSCLRAFHQGFCAATEEGVLHFYREVVQFREEAGNQPKHLRFDLVRKWTCDSLRNYRVVSMAAYEVHKDSEIYLAVATKAQNIVYLNIMRQIYQGGTGRTELTLAVEDDMVPPEDVKFETVGNGFHSGGISCMDISVQRPILVTASREDSTVRFWNYYTGQCELSRRYFVLEKEKDAGDKLREQAKPLLTLALHPSGYYLAAGFMDKVRIMHVLHDELREFRTLEIKNCNRIKFSNGGQFLALTDQKNIFLYASYTVENLLPNNKPLKSPSQQISQIAFNANDTLMVIISNDGFIYRYDLLSFQKTKDGTIDRNCDYRACLFLPDPLDDCRVLTVGADNQRGMFKVYNGNEDQQLNVVCDASSPGFARKYTEVCLVRSFLSGIENLVVGTDRGQIRVFAMPPSLHQEFAFDSFNAHLGEVTRVLTSPDGRYVFSAGADGTVFVFSVTEYQNEATMVRQELSVPGVRDEQLRLE